MQMLRENWLARQPFGSRFRHVSTDIAMRYCPRAHAWAASRIGDRDEKPDDLAQRLFNINCYIGTLHLAAAHDSTLATAFRKVVNLMIPPPSLRSPAIAWRVWRGNGKSQRPFPRDNHLERRVP
jgi:hypothetical protein